uniref:STIL N-terminal domain-containing protein n=1 Tax=Trichobilharzia regenti TaxID=157069 RepID=A0AA85JSJ4_TRIRE|nr:unnamed protein product [Trichobilharzia regenti]CAH8868902.1 unnamed protein product [Trichobilharzia regenti]
MLNPPPLFYSEIKFIIPEKVCKLAHRMMMMSQCQRQLNTLTTYLYGKLSSTTMSSLQICVNRIELNTGLFCQPNLCNEVIIPFELSKSEISEHVDKQFIDCAVHSIWNEYSVKSISLDITNCLQFKAYASLSRSCDIDPSKRTSCLNVYFSKFKLDCLLLDCSLRLTPIIRKPSLVSSVLVKSLETREFHLSSRFTDLMMMNECDDHDYDVRLGYLKMTDSGLISLHLDTDPTVITSSSIGIWISGIKDVHDFRVWKACLQYILSRNNQINESTVGGGGGGGVDKKHKTSDSPPMSLLAIYDLSGGSSFYNVTIQYAANTNNYGWCSSSALLKINQRNNDAIELKFTVLSSCENSPLSSSSSSSVSLKHSDYFTWNLSENVSCKEKYMSVLKDSVKQLCKSVYPIEYLESEAVCREEARQISSLPQSVNWENTPDNSPVGHRSVVGNQYKNIDLSDCPIPEASLLLEEGVETSYRNFTGGNQSTPSSIIDKLNAESLPREPLKKLNDSAKQLSEYSTDYDPERYKNSPKSKCTNSLQQLPPPTPAASVHHITLSPQNTQNHLTNGLLCEIQSTFNSTNDTTLNLQSILSRVPQSQLERLEQIITQMLNKHDNRNTDQNKNDHLQKGISVGVNTTFVASEINSKYKENLIDNGGSSIRNVEKVEFSGPTSASSSGVIDQKRTKHRKSVESSTHRNHVKTLFPEHPFNQLPEQFSEKAQNKVQTISQSKNGSPDKYTLLLANIQQVLNNKVVRCNSTQSEQYHRHSNTENVLVENNANCITTQQQQQVHTSNSIPNFLPQNNEQRVDSNLSEFKNPEKINRRVSNWLSSDSAEGRNHKYSIPVSQAGDTTPLVVVSGYCSRGEIHTYSDRHGPPNQTGLTTNNNNSTVDDINCMQQQDQISHLMTDANQSLYLASLVNKYLGDKKLRDTSSTDHFINLEQSSVEIDYSMATLDYMKRHGILDNSTDCTTTEHFTTPVSSTPAIKYKKSVQQNNNNMPPAIISNRPLSSIPFESIGSKTSDARVSLTLGESLPNLLNKLHLDKSHLMTTTTEHNKVYPTDDIQYLSTISDDNSSSGGTHTPRPRPLANNSGILPIGNDTSTTIVATATVGVDSPILDLERLRSLPKLL